MSPLSLCVSFLFVLTVSVAQGRDIASNLHGIAFAAVTTEDAQRAARWYSEFLGAKHLTDLSFSFYGDEHYYRFFQKEILEARAQGIDPDRLGVPDISDNGNYEIRGEFVLFDNGLVQLIEFARRDTEEHITYPRRIRLTGPGVRNAPQICLWTKDDLDFNQFVHELEEKSIKAGYDKAIFNRAVKVKNEEERRNAPIKDKGINVKEGPFAGLSFVYMKGPSGEQLELYKMVNHTRWHFGKEYCKRRGVTTAFLDNYKDNEYKKKAGLTGQMWGLVQFGTHTDDLFGSVNFYSNVLGSQTMEYPMQAIDLKGDPFKNMLYQKETLEAARLGIRPREFGILDVSANGGGRIDYRFNLFDNYHVETLRYTDGPTMDYPSFPVAYNHSSLAYVGDMAAAFHVNDNADFNQLVADVERRAEELGFEGVKANRVIDVRRLGEMVDLSEYSRPFTSGNLEGYNYVVMKGRSGEHIMFVQLRGPMGEKVKQAMLEYGAVSTAWPETNPWTYGGYDEFCSKYHNLDASPKEEL
ncbi:uncharacterized protein LOC101854868 [Aplysia californica]|uniref:Uncharacterized protein LOC101854868 n=1 Tax=Aplysia californica TaxID=6500 RepID=A0ABM0JQV6_APLCA|nr:uncharacterized protein LOC101854868 [Aplysia californica]